MKIIYIAGWGRSGTTLMDSVLGQPPGFFSVGELRWIWERGVIENRACGCGRAFADCEVWRDILNEAGMVDLTDADARALVERTNRLRTRHLPLLLIPGLKPLARRRAEPLVDDLTRLTNAIADRTGARVLVDSSKFPSYGYALSRVPGVDFRVVHMVRDPRAVAYSWWRRPKTQPDSRVAPRMKRHDPVSSTLYWAAWNDAITRLWGDSEHYRLIRYEDFAARPRETVGAILEWAGEAGAEPGFVDERTVRLEPAHTVSGNPGRFDTGEVEIRVDQRWRTGLPGSERWAVTALAWPWLARYGYR